MNSMCQLVSIHIFPEKKAPKQDVDCAAVRRHGGLEGDFHASGDARAISIIGIETLETLKREGIVGLCTSKFSANLVTKGLTLGKLKPNTRMMAGEVELMLTQIGKECFAACGMEDRAKCPLKAECAFAIALNSGTLSVGCDVSIVEASE